MNTYNPEEKDIVNLINIMNMFISHNLLTRYRIYYYENYGLGIEALYKNEDKGYTVKMYIEANYHINIEWNHWYSTDKRKVLYERGRFD